MNRLIRAVSTASNNNTSKIQIGDKLKKSINIASLSPSFSPTTTVIKLLSEIKEDNNNDNDIAEETHDEDAYTALVLIISLIVCVMFSYWIKVNNIYYLSER